MRRFLNKLKKADSPKYVAIPSPTFEITYSELMNKTNRGYLAQKIGQYVGLDSIDWERIIYSSLTKSTFTDTKDPNELLLHLADQMLQWKEEKVDIQENILRLAIDPLLEEAMLKVYEKHKQDLLFVQKEMDLNQYEEDVREWQIYRDVMYAATQGQFLLIQENEIETFQSGIILCEGVIVQSSDIPKCRNLAKEQFEKMDMPNSKMMSLLLVLSEAITNTIKHAEKGQMILVEDQNRNEIRFIIKDKGPGFELEDLPKKILLSGYSTKKSLGKGFTLMGKVATKIVLHTSPYGSTLILVINAKEGKENHSKIFR